MKENLNNVKTKTAECESNSALNRIVSKPFYSCDGIEIYKGDCMDVMKALRPSSVKMVLTDPPYTSPIKHAFGRKIIKKLSDLSIQEYYFTAIKVEWERILCENAPALVFCDNIYNAVLTGLFYEWQQIDTVIWDKENIGMGNPFRKQHEFIFYANRGSIELNKTEITYLSSIQKSKISKKYHGAEKPIKILNNLITGLTRAGDLILDPFMGSGSTLIAARECGRKAIGIESEQEYIDIAIDRLNETMPLNSYKAC